MKVQKLPVTILRGGTSKGVYILQSDLPADRAQWEPLLLRLMGSPDRKQIDGLGGSQSVTSKVAIIQKSDRPDADVDYTFAQVSVDKPLVSYKGNCGNISSGVGPFAIEKGLVKAKDGETPVRIYNTNTDKIIEAVVQTPGGEVAYQGDFYIAGVPGTASPVKLKFVDPAGTLVFICGVGVLVSVIDMMGGIDLISNLLQKLMNKHTATPVLAATSGILSWVSSTTGVVMPAMFKMLPNIMRTFGTNVNYMEMISAITATSFAAAISPLSTGGAIIMSSYSASKETTNAELNKIFKFLFLLSVGNVLLNVALSAIRLFGFYGIFG